MRSCLARLGGAFADRAGRQQVRPWSGAPASVGTIATWWADSCGRQAARPSAGRARRDQGEVAASGCPRRSRPRDPVGCPPRRACETRCGDRGEPAAGLRGGLSWFFRHLRAGASTRTARTRRGPACGCPGRADVPAGGGPAGFGAVESVVRGVGAGVRRVGVPVAAHVEGAVVVAQVLVAVRAGPHVGPAFQGGVGPAGRGSWPGDAGGRAGRRCRSSCAGPGRRGPGGRSRRRARRVPGRGRVGCTRGTRRWGGSGWSVPAAGRGSRRPRRRCAR